MRRRAMPTGPSPPWPSCFVTGLPHCLFQRRDRQRGKPLMLLYRTHGLLLRFARCDLFHPFSSEPKEHPNSCHVWPTFRSLYVHFFIKSLLVQISNVELLYTSISQLSIYVRGYDAQCQF